MNQLFEERYKTTGETNSESGLYLKVLEIVRNPKRRAGVRTLCRKLYPHIANQECDVYLSEKDRPDKPFTVDWRRLCNVGKNGRYPQEMVNLFIMQKKN